MKFFRDGKIGPAQKLSAIIVFFIEDLQAILSEGGIVNQDPQLMSFLHELGTLNQQYRHDWDRLTVQQQEKLRKWFRQIQKDKF
ncbi:MAG: hypothetical protein AAF206_11125 [Bacteroidota bacterium]